MLPASRPSVIRTRGAITTVVIASTLFALPLSSLRPVSDPSPWLHLKVGRFLLDGQRFRLPDPWSPFAIHEYLPTQWLPSVLSAGLYSRFGTAALAWERTAGVTLLALSLLLWSSTLTRLWVAATGTVLVLFAAWPSLTERPQLAGFVLLVPVLAAWWRTGNDHRPRWWLIPLTWLAAATHGIWATAAGLGGLVTLALLLSRRLTRAEALRLGGLLAGCATAAACTPLGPRLLLTPFTVGSQGRMFVQEWMPSSVRSPHVIAALVLLAAAWLCWIVRQQCAPVWQLALFLAGVVLALSMERTVAVAAMVALPLACSVGEAALPPVGGSVRQRSAWLIWSAAACAGIALAIPLAGPRADAAIGLPTGLQEELDALPTSSRILVDGDTSGWVLFAAPHLRPIYDLRVESYSSQRVKDYITMMNAEPGWDQLLTRSGASSALVPTDAPIRTALTEQFRWTEVGDDAGLVLIRAPR